MSVDLKGVPETLLIPLWARAAETAKPNPLVTDDKACEIVAGLDYDFSKFEKAWLTQVGVSVRTKLLDEGVRAFLRRNPDAVVVNLGAGLDTRYTRLAEENVLWYDLDLPDAIDLRRRFFTATDRWRFLPKSMFDLSWTDEVQDEGRPVLLIAEGLFMYFDEAELKPLVAGLAERFAGAEMFLETLASILVGRSRHHDSVTKMEEVPDFKWGLKDSRDLTRWHPAIEIAEEWNYFDFHKDRWKWFGRIARLPVLRSRMASRIVHLRFAKPAEGDRPA